MQKLKIYLFGNFELIRGATALSGFPTRRSSDLFSFLALHRNRLHSREVLASTFWRERPSLAARKCLRTEIWRIRRTLDDEGSTERVLMVKKDSLGINPEADVFIDAIEFEDRLAPFESREKISTPEEIRCFKEAIAIYRGELLEGQYEDWCINARERMRSLYQAALEKLMLFHSTEREWPAAIYYGRQLLGHDPLLEHIHRVLMRCYWEMGNRVAALRQYASCAELLMKELEVEPMRETSRLYRQIRAC